MTENEKTLADLAEWISTGIQCTEGSMIWWRAILKFMQDFESDNNLTIKLEKRI